MKNPRKIDFTANEGSALHRAIQGKSGLQIKTALHDMAAAYEAMKASQPNRDAPLQVAS